jgi:hypothetical protein
MTELKRKGSQWLCEAGCAKSGAGRTAGASNNKMSETRSASQVKRTREEGEGGLSSAKKVALDQDDAQSDDEMKDRHGNEPQTEGQSESVGKTQAVEQVFVVDPEVRLTNSFEVLEHGRDVIQEDDLCAQNERVKEYEQNEVVERRKDRDPTKAADGDPKTMVVIQRVDGGMFEGINLNTLCAQLLAVSASGIQQPFLAKDRTKIFIPTMNEEAKSKILGITQLCGVTVTGTSKDSREAKESVRYRIEGVDVTFSEDELRETLKDQGVTRVARVTYIVKGVTKNSGKVMLTFEKGATPDKIRLGFNSHAVVLFREPRWCYRCLSYDHVVGECVEQGNLCGNCGGNDHLRRECKNEAKCVNCQGPHKAGAAICKARRAAINRDNLRLAEKVREKATSAAAIPIIKRADGIDDKVGSNGSTRPLYSKVVVDGIRTQSKPRNRRNRSQSRRKTASPASTSRSRLRRRETKATEISEEARTEDKCSNAMELRLQRLAERLDEFERVMQQFKSLDKVVNKLECIMSRLMESGIVMIEDEDQEGVITQMGRGDSGRSPDKRREKSA